MRSLEAVALAASQQEPVLLVGETGTGKTTLVQHLAEQVGFLPALRAPLGVACSKPVSLMMLQHAIASFLSPAHKMGASWLSCERQLCVHDRMALGHCTGSGCGRQ